MRVQHNIMAMNAYRNYNNNTSALSTNLEKLSSGYKINRAGDDAAGLAISEKMRAQITGLNAAQKNVKDATSLVKTAEGAMQEIQDMLRRMKYLATQSANGTYDEEVDRANLQREVDSLLEEIDRIAENANFNGIKLLDGSKDNGTITIDSVKSAGGGGNDDETKAKTMEVSITSPDAQTGIKSVKITGLSEDIKSVQIDTAAANSTAAGNGSATASFDATSGKLTITITPKNATGTSEVSNDDVAAAIKTAANLTAEQKEALKNVKFEADLTGIQASKTGTAANTTETKDDTSEQADNGIALQDDGYVVYATGKGEVSGTGKSDIVLVAAVPGDGEEDEGTPAVTGTIKSGAGLAAVLDSEKASTGDIKVQYSNNKWTVSVGSKSIEATGTVTNGVLTLKDESNAVLLTVEASDKDNASADEAAFKAAFGNAVTTGLKYTAPTGGTKPGDSDAVVKSGDTVAEIDLSSVKIKANDTFTIGDKVFKIIEKQAEEGQALGGTGTAADPYQVNVDAGFTKDQALQALASAITEKKDDLGISATYSGGKLTLKAEKDFASAEDLKKAVTVESNNEDVKKAWNDAVEEAAKKLDGGGKKGNGRGILLQIGDTAGETLTVSIGDMHVKAMDLTKLDISTAAAANKAIDKVKNAINYVSAIRGQLGAYQNRLDHTANNLSVMAENIQDAESTIRDTDVAEEMMSYVKNNILVQSAQAMLAQANQVPQGVLQLLG